MLMQMDINADKLGRRISVFRSSLLKILGPMLRLLASFFSKDLSHNANCSSHPVPLQRCLQPAFDLMIGLCSLISATEALQTLDFKQLEGTAFLSRKFFRLGRFIRYIFRRENVQCIRICHNNTLLPASSKRCKTHRAAVRLTSE
jgi:hypothetical protein